MNEGHSPPWLHPMLSNAMEWLISFHCPHLNKGFYYNPSFDITHYYVCSAAVVEMVCFVLLCLESWFPHHSHPSYSAPINRFKKVNLYSSSQWSIGTIERRHETPRNKYKTTQLVQYTFCTLKYAFCRVYFPIIKS